MYECEEEDVMEEIVNGLDVDGFSEFVRRIFEMREQASGMIVAANNRHLSDSTKKELSNLASAQRQTRWRRMLSLYSTSTLGF